MLLLQYICVFVKFIPILFHNYYDDKVLPISMKYSWFVQKILNICKTHYFPACYKSPENTLIHQSNILNQHNFPVFFNKHLLKPFHKKCTFNNIIQLSRITHVTNQELSVAVHERHCQWFWPHPTPEPGELSCPSDMSCMSRKNSPKVYLSTTGYNAEIWVSWIWYLCYRIFDKLSTKWCTKVSIFMTAI